MTRATQSFPIQKLSLEMTPLQVAQSLQHLPHLIFFDTSGNLPSRSATPLSIIAARPTKLLKGDIGNLSQLQKTIREYQKNASAPHSHTFPNGGACGWIDYEGFFCFGIYPEMLVYCHRSQQWWQCGDLTNSLSSPAPDREIYIGSFSPSMTKEQYVHKVKKIQEYIAAGDIYQVNLTQKFSAPIQADSLFPLYRELRKRSPAPMAAWLQLDNKEILSSSPETFLKMSGRHIETSPIKGTRPRGRTPEEDQAFISELLNSPKEKAELTMITDLLRNDIGQVSEFGSVHVEKMLSLEKLEQVYHLVSTITGKLKNDISHLDALVACFPGGSITGAPKKRAMEIIHELEPVPRDIYTGAIGYFGFNGNSQFNIPIRTLIHENNSLHYHVGAGIVADSIPKEEYQENLDKAKGLNLALQAFQR